SFPAKPLVNRNSAFFPCWHRPCSFLLAGNHNSLKEVHNNATRTKDQPTGWTEYSSRSTTSHHGSAVSMAKNSDTDEGNGHGRDCHRSHSRHCNIFPCWWAALQCLSCA